MYVWDDIIKYVLKMDILTSSQRYILEWIRIWSLCICVCLFVWLKINNHLKLILTKQYLNKKKIDDNN